MQIVALEPEMLDKLLEGTSLWERREELYRSYFSTGSRAECILTEGNPVFAAGIVNAGWRRGVAWILPTPFFREHLRTCMKAMKKRFPEMAKGFRRVQAECIEGVSSSIIWRLGFQYEGTLQRFGPNGERCRIFARIFEEAR